MTAKIYISTNSLEVEEARELLTVVRLLSSIELQTFKESRKIATLEEAIRMLSNVAENAKSELEEAKNFSEALSVKKREVEGTIKSDSEMTIEIVEKALFIIGFNTSVIASELKEIEKLVNWNRKKGFFKSSEKSDIYEKFGVIKKYLDKFPEIRNEKLEDLCNINADKLFKLNFDDAKNFHKNFRIR